MLQKMKKRHLFRAFIQRQFSVKLSGLVLMLMTICLVSGCGKKSPPPASQAPVAATDTNQAPAVTQAVQAPAVNQPATSYSQTNGEPDLRALDRVLIRWIVGHKRRPADFQEFAATAGAPIPPPPPGKKYVIAPNMQIQLVNQ
jgi:predicted small lipoprotein YifL